MNPVTPFPDEKGGKNKKKIGRNKLKQRIFFKVDDAGDKRKAYPQYGNKDNFQNEILDHDSSGYGSLKQFLIRSFSCVLLKRCFLYKTIST